MVSLAVVYPFVGQRSAYRWLRRLQCGCSLSLTRGYEDAYPHSTLTDHSCQEQLRCGELNFRANLAGRETRLTNDKTHNDRAVAHEGTPEDLDQNDGDEGEESKALRRRQSQRRPEAEKEVVELTINSADPHGRGLGALI